MGLKEWAKESPEFVQKPLRWAYDRLPVRMRHGKAFWDAYHFLDESQNWTRKQIEEYQWNQLSKLLKFCSQFVPFYQQRWAEYGININNIKSIIDLNKLPFTTKHDIIQHGNSMVPSCFDTKTLIPTRTGGTTGAPANFYQTKESSLRELAYFHRYWKWHGYNPFEDQCVTLRGSYVVGKPVERRGNMHAFSAFNLTQQQLIYYIKYIKENQIPFIQAYPSLMYELFRTAAECKLKDSLSCMKKVFCGSEKLLTFQRELVEKEFNIPVIIHYGHQELGALFQQCPDNKAYHLILEYGITDFIDDEDGLYEIVSTGFNNYATPLIRYKTGDYAQLTTEDYCSCNLPYPKTVLDVIGRSGDLLYTPSGKVINPNHLEYAIRYIEHFQDTLIIQDDFDHLTVLIVPSEGYSEQEGIQFKDKLLWRLNDLMNINIKLVDSIERSKLGKKRFTVNNLKNHKGEGN